MNKEKRWIYHVAQMGHELRTPLNAIKGFGEILDSELLGSLNEKQKQYIEKILLSSNHLLNIINQILEWAKLSTNEAVLQQKKVTLYSMCVGVVSVQEMILTEKNLKIEIDIPKSLEVFVDQQKFNQVLINIIYNAIKFSKPDSIIKLHYVEEDKYHCLSIIDQGCGIEQHLLKEIFLPFNQSSQRSDGSKGSGLGLWISKAIMEAHQGDIEVISEPEKGSTFTLKILK